MKEKQKIWVTKYALTKGIFEVACEVCDGGMMVYIGENNWRTCYHRKDYSLDKESALSVAEAMLIKKLVSLKKQITKFENMEIKVACNQTKEN